MRPSEDKPLGQGPGGKGGEQSLECRGQEMKLRGAGRVGDPGQQRPGGEPPGVKPALSMLVIPIERSRAS